MAHDAFQWLFPVIGNHRVPSQPAPVGRHKVKECIYRMLSFFLCNTAEGAPNNGPIGTRKDFRVMEVSVIDSRAEESRPFFSEFRAIGFGLNQFSTLSHVYEMHGLGARLELLEDD